jgi:S-(hydroxymethyl)glutathione dehydrogenase/alcohol dehydrogenase
VIGAGGVGQFVVQGARIAGAAEIVCVDPLMERLQLAVQLGASRAVQPEWLEETMKEALPEGVDYAFDAVGDPETTALAFRWTRNGGSCVIVGLPKAGARLDLDPVDFVRRERVLTGTIYGSEDPAVSLPTLLEHLQGGRLELAALLGQTYPLEQVNDAVEASLAGAPGRVLVTP